ncbi:MAG: hypothetical protein HY033_03180, partial [Ignavibacteriae bacterium]|nr:hypothetical protein [Ignavibacteriota bacterium]
MKVLLIIFALTLPFSNVYARQYGSKQDTLVDVFPLSVNRKWIYHTENFFINNEANGYYISDSGSAAIKITTETEMTDSTVWFFEEHQNFLHREGFLGGRVDTTYKVLNVVIFQLIELHDSLHQVLIRGNSSAFRWTSDYFIPETSRVYRYR